jgi:hypothetical protein
MVRCTIASADGAAIAFVRATQLVYEAGTGRHKIQQCGRLDVFFAPRLADEGHDLRNFGPVVDVPHCKRAPTSHWEFY